MIVPWETLEDRIAARISAVMPNSFRAVAAVGNVEAMRRALNQYPVCYVEFDGEEYGENLTFDNVMQTGVMGWNVYVIARSMRGPAEARKGMGGSFDLAGDVRITLEGFDPIENSDASGVGHPLVMQYARPANDIESEQAKFSMVLRFMNECENR